MIANGVFSGGCGYLAWMMPSLWVSLLGIPIEFEWTMVALGWALIGYSLVLLYIAVRYPLLRVFSKVAVILDFLWVVGALLIYFFNVVRPTVSGAVVFFGVTLLVGLFACVQYLGLKHEGLELNRTVAPDGSVGVVRSWLSMKMWVKCWLFFLNFVFLMFFFYVGETIARWVLVCYVTSGLYLFVFMWAQKGLTRLLGLAHIVPWTGLLIMLMVSLVGGAGPIPAIAFSQSPLFFLLTLLLMLVISVCLIFDYFDVYRWFIGGERFVLGSQAAADHGASRLAKQV